MTFPFPVFCPVVAGGGTFSLKAVTAGSGATISVPSGVAAGDLIFVFNQAVQSKGSPPGSVTPSGFTGIRSDTYGSRRLNMSYKIAAGTETTVTGMDGSAFEDWIVAVFGGGFSSASHNAGSFSSSTGDPSAINLNSDSGSPPLIAFGGFAVRGSDAVFGSMSVAGGGSEDGKYGIANDGSHGATGNRVLWLFWKIFNAAPADVTFDMDDMGTDNALQACWVEGSS